jgi:hypothetical protein
MSLVFIHDSHATISVRNVNVFLRESSKLEPLSINQDQHALFGVETIHLSLQLRKSIPGKVGKSSTEA